MKLPEVSAWGAANSPIRVIPSRDAVSWGSSRVILCSCALEAPAVPLMVNTRISSTATTRFNMDTAPFVIASFAKKAGAAQPPLLFWALISVLIITHISTNCKFRYKSGGCFQHPVLFDNEIDQLVLYHDGLDNPAALLFQEAGDLLIRLGRQ